MGGTVVGFFVEVLVASLLMVTIVYCVRLNRKLERLRADETDMKNLVNELIEATGNAEQAIQSLKGSAGDWDRALGSRMRHAEKLSGTLHEQTDAAEIVLDRLKQICAAASAANAASQADAARKAEAAPQHDFSTPTIAKNENSALAAARKRLGLERKVMGAAQPERAA